jgi:hypothetical protein
MESDEASILGAELVDVERPPRALSEAEIERLPSYRYVTIPSCVYFQLV